MIESTTKAKSPGERSRRVIPESESKPSMPVLPLVERYGLVLLFALVLIFFTVYSGSARVFPTAVNFNTIVGNQSVLALVALASIVPLIAGQFDLSVGAVLGCSGVVTAALIRDAGLPVPIAIAVGIAFGGVVGIVNGFLVAYVGVNALIGTLGVSTALAGLAYAYSATPIIDIPSSLTKFGAEKWFGLPTMLFVLVLFAISLYYLLDYTLFGRRLNIVGSNAEAARLVGIPVRKVTMGSFVTSGLIAGVAGVLQVCRSGSADSLIGNSFLLPALAAAFLGATAIRPGRFNVVGTLVAVFFLAASVSGLTLSGVESWIQDVFTGVALVAGVSISSIISKRRGRQ